MNQSSSAPEISVRLRRSDFVAVCPHEVGPGGANISPLRELFGLNSTALTDGSFWRGTAVRTSIVPGSFQLRGPYARIERRLRTSVSLLAPSLTSEVWLGGLLCLTLPLL